MQITSLSIFTLMGTALAGIPKIDMDVDDAPLVTVSRAAGIANCCRRTPTTELGELVRQAREGDLKGPCQFLMKQTHSGNVEDYLSKTAQITNDRKRGFTNFLVELTAPEDLRSYIDRIYFVQETPGINCSSFRLSESTKEGYKLRYYRGIRSADDISPVWEIGRRRQIQGGYYLLEVPSSCLVKPKDLIIEITHVYEDPGMQLKPIKGRGEIVAQSDACSIPLNRTAVDSYESYLQITETQPRGCEYSYKREYEWIVPASHISVKDGKTTVWAQLSLHESMLGEERRHIAKLSLSSLSGSGCSKVALYAHGTRDGGESSARIENVKYFKADLSVDVVWGFSDQEYDLRFVLPSDCQVENPTVRVVVDDHKEVDARDSEVEGHHMLETMKSTADKKVDATESGVDNDDDVAATESVTTRQKRDVTTQFSTTSILQFFMNELKAQPGVPQFPRKDDGHAYYWDGNKVQVIEEFV